MRRLLLLVTVLLALSAAVALAQTSPPITVTVYPKVTPNAAGTPAHPQGVHLDVRIKIGIPVNYDPPLVSEIDVWFPRGGLYNGGKYPTCSVRKMDEFGPSGCPKTSIMGYGSGVARADDDVQLPEDHRHQRRPAAGLLLHRAQQPGAGAGARAGDGDQALRPLVLQAPRPDPEEPADRRRDSDRAAVASHRHRPGRLDRDHVVPADAPMAMACARRSSITARRSTHTALSPAGPDDGHDRIPSPAQAEPSPAHAVRRPGRSRLHNRPRRARSDRRHGRPDRQDARVGGLAAVPVRGRVRPAVPVRAAGVLVPDADLDGRVRLRGAGAPGGQRPRPCSERSTGSAASSCSPRSGSSRRSSPPS